MLTLREAVCNLLVRYTTVKKTFPKLNCNGRKSWASKVRESSIFAYVSACMWAGHYVPKSDKTSVKGLKSKLPSLDWFSGFVELKFMPRPFILLYPLIRVCHQFTSWIFIIKHACVHRKNEHGAYIPERHTQREYYLRINIVQRTLMNCLLYI